MGSEMCIRDSHWVNLYGQDNRVDHSRFQGQTHSGVTVVVVLDNNGTNARHLIDSNAFLDRPVGNGNGFEAIRIGTSARHTTSAQVVVENNLFERIDGEIEIISNKSGDNVYRYNTFRNSAGTLTLRHGDAATVDSNFFLGEGRDRSGGIRVVGEDHVIVNNYIADIDDRADGAISLVVGIINSPANGYQPVKNAQIYNNTIVDVQGAAVKLDWGLGGTDNGGLQDQFPEDVLLVNNLIRSTASPLFEGQEGDGWTWDANIVDGASLGITGREGLLEVDPQLSLDADGLWRTNSSSPAIDGGEAIAFVTDDMDGQARIGLIDIGADESSTDAIVRRPLTADDVGPDWIGDSATTTGPFAIAQAEGYAGLTDPNGDGDVWSVVADNQAICGSALEAPSGSRTDIGNSPHDTLAMYNVTFGEAGEYTAYYRAYGVSGSTNSFYSPTGFGVDPTVAETTSTDGIYSWVVGETYSVTESNVGVPMELRIGRREGLTRIDSIAFHQDTNLTDEQLDALFIETVEVIVNQGNDQRSMITELEVSFSGDVQIGDSAFSLLKRGDGEVPVTFSTSNSDGTTTATILFSGQYTEASGSLVDGNYQLSIDGGEIFNTQGKNVDVDGDGSAGGVLVIGDEELEQFYRLFGDVDQNRVVNVVDLLGFRQTFLLLTGDASFEASFDVNVDGIVNVIDLLRFRGNFLKTLPFDD